MSSKKQVTDRIVVKSELEHFHEFKKNQFNELLKQFEAYDYVHAEKCENALQAYKEKVNAKWEEYLKVKRGELTK